MYFGQSFFNFFRHFNEVNQKQLSLLFALSEFVDSCLYGLDCFRDRLSPLLTHVLVIVSVDSLKTQ